MKIFGKEVNRKDAIFYCTIPALVIIAYATFYLSGRLSFLHEKQIVKDIVEAGEQSQDDADEDFQIVQFEQEGIAFNPPALNEWSLQKPGVISEPIHHDQWKPTKGVWSLWRFGADTSTLENQNAERWLVTNDVSGKLGKFKLDHYFVRLNSIAGINDFVWTPALLAHSADIIPLRAQLASQAQFHYMTPAQHMSAMAWIKWITPYMALANLGGSYASDIAMVIDDEGVVRDVFTARAVEGADYIQLGAREQSIGQFIGSLYCRVDRNMHTAAVVLATQRQEQKNAGKRDYDSVDFESRVCTEGINRNLAGMRHDKMNYATSPWFPSGTAPAGADAIPVNEQTAKALSKALFK